MKFSTRFNKLVAIGLVLLMVSVGIGYSLTRTITDTGDTVDTFIRNSKGNYWTATGANLQLAFNDLNNQTGWVNQPGGSNITLTNTLYVGDKSTYYGNWGTLYLGNLVNKTLIENYNHGIIVGGTYVANGNNTDIHIYNLIIDGNQYHQPKFSNQTNNYRMIDGIRLTQTHNSSIENVIVRNTLNRGIYWICSKNIRVNNFKAYNCGLNWSTGMFGTETQNQYVSGLWFGSCQNITVSDSYFGDIWNAGIIFERAYLTGSPLYIKKSCNMKVVNCEFHNAFCGIWSENAQYGVISNCVFENISRIENVYTLDASEPMGIYVSADHIEINNCFFNYCGNISVKTSATVWFSGSNNTVSDCILKNNYGNGTRLLGNDNTVENCIIENSTYGVLGLYSGAASAHMNPNILHNKIMEFTISGVYLLHMTNSIRFSNKRGLIHGNEIYTSVVTAGVYAIYNKLYNMTITDNTIRGSYYAINNYASNCTINDNHISGPGLYGIYMGRGASSLDGNFNSICGNTILNAVSDGIRIQYNFSNINDNIIFGCGGDGIQIGVASTKARNNTIMGNIINRCTVGIYEFTDADYTKIIGNNCIGCTTPIDISGTNTTWFVSAVRCYGFNTGAIS